MKLDDKRKVIEVLLCDAYYLSVNEALRAVTGLLAHRVQLHRAADRRITAVYRDRDVRRPGIGYSDARITAAYRLIESSPTLRREWFGAR